MDSTSTDGRGGGGVDGEELEHSHVMELVASTDGSDSALEDQIAPLLTQSDKPKINIFSVSYPRRKTNKDQVTRLIETETSPFSQFIMWVWSGSRYSGLLCMVLSSSIYCIMEVLLDVFSAQAIPLFEIAFTRSVIISVISFLWLRRSAQPIFGPANVRNLLVSRAIAGCISLLTFIYCWASLCMNFERVIAYKGTSASVCIQRLPLSQAMILSLTTPIMASIAARFILHENFKIAEISGIAFSFFGVLFILGSAISIQGVPAKVGEAKVSAVHGLGHVYAVLIGLISSLAGGVSYCLVRAGAKASDQPVGTIFSFGLLFSPAAAICMITTENFVMPSFYSFVLMCVLGVLAFLAELFLARGLQLERASRVANIQYLEVALFQLWGMGSSRIILSFGRLVGCFLIFVSACCTIYFGREKEME